ncbi:MAG: hypothetical protein JXQ99_10830 [Hyphomicrobiaceae bacterium]
MKFTINVDCTPEEARAFFGLPDVSGVNEMIMEGLAKRTEENLETFTDPQKFFEAAMAGGLGNMEAMQKMFSAMATGAPGSSKRD